jgi:MFS family permease
MLALGTIAFCVLMGEGAVADWSAVFLRQDVGAGAALAGAGFAAFSLAMAGGRLVGDVLNARLGAVALLRLGGAVAGAGMALALVPDGAALSILGFGLVGAGLSTLFPTVIGAAGRTRDAPTGTVIATITALGYFGFLAGPPLIGLLADVAGLRAALGVVVALALLVVAVAGSARD